MPFIHLAQIVQGFAGNKLIGVGQAGSCNGDTPRLHFQELVTGANVHRDFTVLHEFLHILTTYVLRMIRNTKADSGGIKNFGEAFLLGVVGRGPIVCHLARKTRNGQGLKAKLVNLRSLTVLRLLWGFLT
jgi:hypothetical protein